MIFKEIRETECENCQLGLDINSNCLLDLKPFNYSTCEDLVNKDSNNNEQVFDSLIDLFNDYKSSTNQKFKKINK
ncbi:hypothetical protein HERIO_1374 [Hepatospora eriocheir]|uniref:Uncharacterized protein n=1 Tax=Hepatospora eriocheir TaxID=1081669 RepID=A0A1X0QA74_9MICR|nr:hypothetical protein HERIO_1374 [Hepatospora eriocheir]